MKITKLNEWNTTHKISFKYNARVYEIYGNMLITNYGNNDVEIEIPSDLFNEIKDVHEDSLDYKNDKTTNFLNWVDGINLYKLSIENELKNALSLYIDEFSSKEEYIEFITNYINSEL